MGWLHLLGHLFGQLTSPRRGQSFNRVSSLPVCRGLPCATRLLQGPSVPGSQIVDISFLLCTSFAQLSFFFINCSSLKRKTGTQPSFSILPGKSTCVLFNKYQALRKKTKGVSLMVKCYHWPRPLSLGLPFFPLRSGNLGQSQNSPRSSLGYRGQLP